MVDDGDDVAVAGDVDTAAAGADALGDEDFFLAGPDTVASDCPFLFLDFGVVTDALDDAGIAVGSAGGFFTNSDEKKLQ